MGLGAEVTNSSWPPACSEASRQPVSRSTWMRAPPTARVPLAGAPPPPRARRPPPAPLLPQFAIEAPRQAHLGMLRRRVDGLVVFAAQSSHRGHDHDVAPARL